MTLKLPWRRWGSGKPEIGVGRKRVIHSWSSDLKICLCETQAHRKKPSSLLHLITCFQSEVHSRARTLHREWKFYHLDFPGRLALLYPRVLAT